jgi:Tol biopolymer transport system component
MIAPAPVIHPAGFVMSVVGAYLLRWPGMAVAPGTRMGPYEVRALLGAGGMGEVYHARDARLERDVALKVLRADKGVDEQRLRRFELEAKTAGGLKHPNVVAVLDVGEHQGVPYVVTELLDGRTLRARLASGPLPMKTALAIAASVAHGLAAAHAKGIVHRDLKPENLFLTRDATVKILDFGLAKLVAQAPVGDRDATLPALTEEGAVLGTVGYMAPEQVRGQTADHRADIFALGAVLHEMITGTPAFPGATPADRALAVVRDDPADAKPPGRAAAPGVAALVRRCLEKSPDDRYQSASDLAFHLEAIAAAEAPSGGAAPRRARAGLGVVVGATAAALAAGLVAGRWWGSRAPVARAPAPEPTRYRRVGFGPALVEGARLLPDGQSFVYGVSDGIRPAGLYLGRVGNAEATPLGHPDTLLMALSTKGRMLLLHDLRGEDNFVHDGTLASAEVTGGGARDLLQNVSWADFYPDGERIAMVTVDGPRYVLDGYGKRLLESSTPIGRIRVSPTGDLVAFLAFAVAGDDRGHIAAVDLEGHVTVLSREYATVGGLAWSPDGRELYYSAADGYARDVHAVTVAEPRHDRVVLTGPDRVNIEDVTASGQLLVLRESQRPFLFAHAPGATEDRDVSLFEADNVTDFSPGDRLLAVSEGGGGADSEYRIYLRPADGGASTRIGDGSRASFAPDGKSVVVDSIVDRRRIRIIPTGPGTTRDLPVGKLISRWWPCFLPDGRRVVFNGLEPGHAERIYVQDVERGDPRPASGEGFALPEDFVAPVSPDGMSVVAIAADHRVSLVPLDGGPPRPLSGLLPGRRPIGWTADGKGVYVLTLQSQPLEVTILDLASGTSRPWRQLGSPTSGRISALTGPKVARDGQAWTYNIVTGYSDLYLVTP